MENTEPITAQPVAEAEHAINNTSPSSPPTTAIISAVSVAETVANTTNSSPLRSSLEHKPPKYKSQPTLSSPSSSTHSPPLSPLHLQSRPESPPPVQSPGASTISCGHSPGNSPVSSPTEENLPQQPPATIPAPPELPLTKILLQDERKAVTGADPGAQAPFAAGGDVEDGDAASHNHNNRRRKGPELSILRKAKTKKTAKRFLLGFRISGFLLCLVSFSVMAADKNRGWALDSFNRYKEFRYSMAVNVIGCAYSGLQAAELAYESATGKQIAGGSNRLRRYYADFFLDQILAYLLMSSSSSAATRVEDWQSNWGEDEFPSMASASVGLSFAAFVALAFSSLVSGYMLCTLGSSST